MKSFRILVVSSLFAAFAAASYAGDGCSSCTAKKDGEKPKTEQKEG